MEISVSLWSNKSGELKRFLNSYYEKDVMPDENIEQWIYVYNKPLEAVDMIGVLMDNRDVFSINMCIQVGKGDLYVVTSENHNDIIKGIFSLFYKESNETLC